jgi:hypothetical protein
MPTTDSTGFNGEVDLFLIFFINSEWIVETRCELSQVIKFTSTSPGTGYQKRTLEIFQVQFNCA